MENILADPVVLELIGSAAVILLMVGVAAILGFRIAARLDEDELKRLAAAEGAWVQDFVIAPDKRRALARLTDGKLMIARVMGLDTSIRIVAPGAVRLKLRPGRLELAFADIGYPPLHMRLKDQPAWLAELASGGN
ncbi:hypothetical protein [Vitreimonas sp.]|uniref:hypothetical protein n=1 Tax=Vitreimonas sp. TaxID=3069702 RepID=UPI002ED8C5AC